MTKYYFSCLMATTFLCMNTGYAVAADVAIPVTDKTVIEAPLEITASTPEDQSTWNNIEITSPEGEKAARGIDVNNRGQAKINNAEIHGVTTGVSVTGGSSYEGDGLVISDVTTGLSVRDSSQATVSNVKITADANGRNSYGVQVYGADAIVSLTDFEIDSKGWGISVLQAGTINLTNGSVNGEGAIRLSGLVSQGQLTAKAQATLDNVQVTSTQNGIDIDNADVTLTNGSTINAELYGIVVGSSSLEADISLSGGSSIVAEEQGLRLATNGKVHAMLDNSSITGKLVYDLSPTAGRTGGRLDLEAANGSVLHGAGRVADGNTAVVSLSDNSSWYVNGDSYNLQGTIGFKAKF